VGHGAQLASTVVAAVLLVVALDVAGGLSRSREVSPVRRLVRSFTSTAALAVVTAGVVGMFASSVLQGSAWAITAAAAGVAGSVLLLGVVRRRVATPGS
jgi:hypothetical protein